MEIVQESSDISHLDLQETRLYRIAMFVVLAMFSAHAFFIGLFWYLEVPEMMYLNIFFSMPLILLGFYFAQKKWILKIAFVCYLEILVHAMFAIYYIGWETGFYFYLVCSIVITQSYPWKLIAKAFMFIAFSLIIIIFYLNFDIPANTLDAVAIQTLFLMNLFVFSGILAAYMWYQVSLSINFENQLNKANTGLKENNQLILNQKSEIEEAHKEIKDSITYAKRIQNAILPPDSLIQQCLNEAFILYKPKDIIAGDFYWLEPLPDEKNTLLLAAADCTGHGVPGAMVSVVCNNGLNRAVREFGLRDPGAILDKTREIVLQEFEKSVDEVKDGMDIALISLDLNTEGTNSSSLIYTLRYAGANNPLWIIRKNGSEIEEIKANKQPIGQFVEPEPYTSHMVELHKGDTFYLFSDGYPDQFGGDRGKKFKSSSFKTLLLSLQNESMQTQKEKLNKAFEDWRGDIEQIDDVCIIGVRV